MIPGEALLKAGVVGLASTAGVVLVKYANRVRTVFKVLKHVPSYLPNRIISSVPDKTITLIGIYAKDMKNVIDELQYPKSLDFGGKPGGFNLLNVPDGYDPLTFWKDYNMPWLKAAADRGDEIIVLSNFMDESLLIKNGRKTGFGNEIEFMNSLIKEGKYKFVKETGKYVSIK